MCNSNIGKGSWIKNIIGNSTSSSPARLYVELLTVKQWLVSVHLEHGQCGNLNGSYSCSDQEFLFSAGHGRAGWQWELHLPLLPFLLAGGWIQRWNSQECCGQLERFWGTSVPWSSYPQAVQNEWLLWDVALLAGRGRSWPVVCLWRLVRFCAWTGKREDAQATAYKNLPGCLHGKDWIYPSP